MSAAKNLNEAIGCWLNTPEYVGCVEQAQMILKQARRCRAIVRRNGSPDFLEEELQLLLKQSNVMVGKTASALSRCENLARDGLQSTAEHYIP